MTSCLLADGENAMEDKEITGREHMSLPPLHSEAYRAQRKKANKSYKAIADINAKAREQHLSYGQYVASEWAKEHVKVERPKEDGRD